MTEPVRAALESAREGDLEARCRAVDRLARIGGEAATEALASLLAEPSWLVRDRVVDALAQSDRAAEPVLRVLREGEWFARASACDALGRTGDPSALEALLEQIEDRNVSLQKSAVGALRNLGELVGLTIVARAVAALPPERRRRVRARVAHQEPHWVPRLEEALGELPTSSFERREEPPREPPSRVTEVGKLLSRFREWLASPAPKERPS